MHETERHRIILSAVQERPVVTVFVVVATAAPLTFAISQAPGNR